MCLRCIDFSLTVSTASTYDASQSLASSRHRVGANPQRTSSSISEVAEGGSVAPASAWQSVEATTVPIEKGVSKPVDRPSMPPQQMRAVAAERVSRIKASIAAFQIRRHRDQLKNQRSTRLVEMVHPSQSSEEVAQLVLERSAKTLQWGKTYRQTSRISLVGWSPKQLELRDALEMGDIGIIKELSQLISKGVLRMECCPSMVSNMVC